LIGRLQRLCELAINIHHGRISVWAFTADGEASVWQLSSGLPQKSITRRTVAKDGRVLDPYQTDADGDVVMEGAAVPTATSHENTSGPSGVSRQRVDQGELLFDHTKFDWDHGAESDDVAYLSTEEEDCSSDYP
jgi:hypothetical protein